MLDKYRDYFDIDPEYFPQINEKVINRISGRSSIRMKPL